MRTFKNGAFLILLFATVSCTKKCEPVNVVCTEVVPVNEACQAYFERWFFDAKKNSCSLVQYSGCNQRGFATKNECENCKCN